MEIKNHYFFNSLSKNELKRLEKISIYKKYSKNDILFQKGENPKYLYFLTKGLVKIYDEEFVHKISGPSLIAEISNFEEIPFPLSCSFEVDSEVYLINYEKFKEEFLHKKEISKLFIKSLSNKIKDLEVFISKNVTVDVNAKVAKFLYENETTLDSIKQINMAEILNIREETLSRKIAKFIKDGIIKKEKRNIKIINHEKLINQFI